MMGTGPVSASAAVAAVGDFTQCSHATQFSHAAQFGALVGLTPRQHSSGGKNNLGGITKRGDNYLRSLLIQGAKSAVMTANKRSDPISLWAAALRERVLAESGRGPGQQECAHPLGGDDPGRGLQPAACECETGGVAVDAQA